MTAITRPLEHATVICGRHAHPDVVGVSRGRQVPLSEVALSPTGPKVFRGRQAVTARPDFSVQTVVCRGGERPSERGGVGQSRVRPRQRDRRSGPLRRDAPLTYPQKVSSRSLRDFTNRRKASTVPPLAQLSAALTVTRA